MRKGDELFHYGANNDGNSSMCVYDRERGSGFIGFSNNKEKGWRLIGEIGDQILRELK